MIKSTYPKIRYSVVVDGDNTKGGGGSNIYKGVFKKKTDALKKALSYKNKRIIGLKATSISVDRLNEQDKYTSRGLHDWAEVTYYNKRHPILNLHRWGFQKNWSKR
jgi:hypothetical protein